MCQPKEVSCESMQSLYLSHNAAYKRNYRYVQQICFTGFVKLSELVYHQSLEALAFEPVGSASGSDIK